MPSSYLIETHHLSFGFDKRKIFDGLNITVPHGKIVAIMGPSGTGKTTLLRLLSGQIKTHHGSILFNNVRVDKANSKELMRLRKQMGMLFQSSALFTDLTVFENVAFPLREKTSLSETLIKILVEMKLELVGLRGAANLMAVELSGGMARRVALARAIILDPILMMYDEPFTGLDPISKAVIVKLIRELNQALGITSIIVSHDVPEVLSIADEIYLLSGGKILHHGTPQDLVNNPLPAVQQFIKGLADGPVPFHYPSLQSYMEALLDVAE